MNATHSRETLVGGCVERLVRCPEHARHNHACPICARVRADRPPVVACWNCEEWEPIINTGCGWCPVFEKETKATHGKQCTAFIPLPPNDKLSGGEKVTDQQS